VLLSQLPLLSRTGHDRAAERREDSEWLAAAWERGRALVVTPDYTAPVTSASLSQDVDGWGSMPVDSRAALDLRPTSAVPADWPRYFLGVASDTPIFAVRGPRDLKADRWMDLRAVGASLNDRDAGLLTAAVALAHWHDRHLRCPLDGTPTVIERAGWVRRCPSDNSEHFPRTDPAVIMLVHDGGDRCVLGRQAVWPPGRFSILAGFVEPGESSEAAVAREVSEEVGLTVTDVTYAGSQPWPFPSSLMLGFTARALGDLTIERRDGELADARWFTRDELRRGDGPGALPPSVSIAHRIITDWVNG
jgi:NAD+ diphosphatase